VPEVGQDRHIQLDLRQQLDRQIDLFVLEQLRLVMWMNGENWMPMKVKPWT